MRTLHTVRGLIAAAILCLSFSSLAAVKLAPLLSSGLSNPVFAGNAKDGSNRLFIVEQGGVVRVLQPGASTPTVFLDVHAKIAEVGEEGLLGLAFHPQYAGNGRFFVFYTRIADGALVIAEYKASANPNLADLAETVLLTIPHPTNSNHNGGMIAFGPDGFLYIGTGDGGSGNDPPNNSQNVNVLLGKILRIDVDHPDLIAGTPYSSPADNPFVGLAGRGEIYALGMRNPWRFSFDRTTGQQWVGDVGQGAREEVDTPIVKGGNYGWRVFEGMLCTSLDPALCNPSNYRFPILDYAHVSGRCSITGGYVYRGSQGSLPLGTYVYADYCSGEIFAWSGSTSSLLLDTTMNISSFGEDEQGELYVVNLGGTLSKLVSVAPPTTTTLTSSANPAAVGAGVSFTATVSGTNPTGTVNFNDGSTSISGCNTVALAGSGNAKTAVCSTNSLAVGTRGIVANYGGDAGNAGSASAPLSQIVTAQNYSDSWWNANESGWGISITDHDTNAFVQWYTYDQTGRNQKYVISSGTFSNGKCQFNGAIQRVTGPSWTLPAFEPNQVTRTTVGAGTIDFCPTVLTAGTIVFNYTVDDVTGSKQLTRLPFGNDVPHWGGSANTGSSDFTDLWWNPAESGWGVSITQHGNNIFFRIFVYDIDSSPLLFVVSGVTFNSASSFTGMVQLTAGPWFGSNPFDSNQVVRTAAGSASLTFSDANNGVLSYTVNGVTKTKSIMRMVF